MKTLEIKEQDLTQICKLSEDYKVDFPHPIYLEFEDSKMILLKITCGTFFDFFTNTQVLFPRGVKIKSLKIILQFKVSDLNLKAIKNAKQSCLNLNDLLDLDLFDKENKFDPSQVMTNFKPPRKS